jgi:hypothetical protein
MKENWDEKNDWKRGGKRKILGAARVIRQTKKELRFTIARVVLSIVKYDKAGLLILIY